MKIKRIIGLAMIIAAFVFLFIVVCRHQGIEVTIKAFGMAIVVTAFIVIGSFLCYPSK